MDSIWNEVASAVICSGATTGVSQNRSRDKPKRILGSGAAVRDAAAPYIGYVGVSCYLNNFPLAACSIAMAGALNRSP